MGYLRVVNREANVVMGGVMVISDNFRHIHGKRKPYGLIQIQACWCGTTPIWRRPFGTPCLTGIKSASRRNLPRREQTTDILAALGFLGNMQILDEFFFFLLLAGIVRGLF